MSYCMYETRAGKCRARGCTYEHAGAPEFWKERRKLRKQKKAALAAAAGGGGGGAGEEEGAFYPYGEEEDYRARTGGTGGGDVKGRSTASSSPEMPVVRAADLERLMSGRLKPGVCGGGGV